MIQKAINAMEVNEIESILLANCYLMQCKLGKRCSGKTEAARRFLLKKIRKALLRAVPVRRIPEPEAIPQDRL